jgi:hypothetical protein
MLGVLGLALPLVGGCAPAPLRPAAALRPAGSVPRTVPAPAGCTLTLTDETGAQDALDKATPGQRLCLTGTYLHGARLELKRSGTREQPIQLESDGATPAGLSITADHVVVEGFNVLDGDGITAAGTDIILRNNDVRGAADDGIRCAPCVNSQVGGSTVVDADGSGIVVTGQNVTVQNNEVRSSRRRTGTDADGLRFAGTAMKILDNTVRSISRHGYPPGPEPTADCIQTNDAFSTATTTDAYATRHRDDDSDDDDDDDGGGGSRGRTAAGPAAQPTSGAVVQGNSCVDVDGHCFSAAGTPGSGGGSATAQPVVRFMDNYCQTGAQQAVALDGYPDVAITGNTFSAAYTAAAVLARGSTGVTVADNILVGPFPLDQVDDASRAGLKESGNRTG